jgi:membrane protein implicated in regulation of membrane protease activity
MQKVTNWFREPGNYIYLIIMIAAIFIGTYRYGLPVTVVTFAVIAVFGLVLRALFFRK